MWLWQFERLGLFVLLALDVLFVDFIQLGELGDFLHLVKGDFVGVYLKNFVDELVCCQLWHWWVEKVVHWVATSVQE